MSNVSELSTEMTVFNKSNFNPEANIDWIQSRKDFIKWCDQIKININISMGVM